MACVLDEYDNSESEYSFEFEETNTDIDEELESNDANVQSM